MMQIILDILTLSALLMGLFFMGVGALGLVRMPDLYNRMHATTKCVTLGISGIMLAVVFNLTRVDDANTMVVLTKVVLIIVFQFVAAPVGAHLLAKAAHLDRIPQCEETLDDELAKDQAR